MKFYNKIQVLYNKVRVKLTFLKELTWEFLMLINKGGMSYRVGGMSCWQGEPG